MTSSRFSSFYTGLKQAIMMHLRQLYPTVRFEEVNVKKRGLFARRSDMDLRFYLSRRHFAGQQVNKEMIYQKILAHLSQSLPTYQGEPLRYVLGWRKNVIKILPEHGGRIDLVLILDEQ